MDLGQARRRLHAGFLDEDRAGAPEGRQRIGLPPGPVQGPHQLPPQPLVPGIPAGQPFQLRDQLRTRPGRQVRLDPVRHSGQAHLVQPRPFSAQSSSVGELAVGLAAPQPQRGNQPLGRHRRLPGLQRPPPLPGQPLEPGRVNRVRIQPQQVSRRPGHDQFLHHARGGRQQRPAQPRQVSPRRPVGVRRGVPPPQPIHQRRHADHPAGVGNQQSQHDAQPRATHLQQAATHVDLQRAEHPKLRPPPTSAHSHLLAVRPPALPPSI